MKNILKVILLAKKYKWILFISVVSMLVQSGISLYTPQIFRAFVKVFETGPELLISKAPYYALILLSLYFLEAVAQFFRTYLTHLAAWNFVHDIRVKLYDHIQSLSLKFFHDKQTGQLLSRISSDTATLEVLVAHALPEIIVNTIILAGVMVILISINVKLALASFAVVPPIVVLVFFFATKVRPMFRDAQQKTAELYAVLQDNITGIKEIQIFNKQADEKRRVSEASQKYTRATMGALKKSAFYHPSITFLNQLGTVIMVGLGGKLASNGAIAISDIAAFLLYLEMFYRPISTLGRLSEDLQNSGAACDRILELLDETSDVSDAPNAKELPRVHGRIEYKNVSFGYIDGHDIIKDLNLTVNPGETLALVGPTGVGKTTIASLTARFYDPVAGEILIDGHNIKDVTQKSLRDNISMVLQDVFLFNGTIAENIAYGVENATMEQIEQAARVANAHDFIMETENGYNTVIGERGMRLSGGQKQRLSIARAILKNAPILILDEATASVDNKTERLIHEAIDNVIKNRTTIIIAHRLSTIKNADKIAFIQNGVVAEVGNHQELMERNGLYAALYRGKEEE